MVRTGLVLALSLLIAPGVRSGAGQVMAFSTFDMVESLIREVILGLVIGCVFHIFFYMLYVAGDFLDTVFGLAMGKVMDPAGGVQTSILGQFVNVFFGSLSIVGVGFVKIPPQFYEKGPFYV